MATSTEDQRYVDYLVAEWQLHQSAPERAEATRAATSHLSIRRVLDAGGGAGQEMQPLAGSGAFGVGADIASMAGPTGRQLYARHVPEARVAFARASMEQLPFVDGAFDVVICRLALPYVDNQAAIAEMARVLRPGSSLLIKLHHLRYYVRQLGRNVQEHAPLAALHSTRVLLNGAVLAVAGLQPRNRWFGRETCQTRAGFLRTAARVGLIFVNDLPDSNPYTPSLHLMKK